MKKRIAVLGSTGSIGVNTLNVIRRHADLFEIVLLTAYNNVDLLARQVREFKPRNVAIMQSRMKELSLQLPRGTRLYDVQRDLVDLVAVKNCDLVVLGMSGAVALDPFLAAVKAGKSVATANKEALVMAGDIIMSAARRSGAQVIPVDSEQSAIFQCLQGHPRKDLARVLLTASGGPLRGVAVSRHKTLSVAQVLRHPRWKMGARITVDSATLMNKGFEFIEAQRLFDLQTEQIDVLVHPQAIVHSMIEFCDGSLLAQLGVPDMRIPIQYALTYPDRVPTGLKRLDLAKVGQLTFEKPDLKAFPSLMLAYKASAAGGTVPAVLNAADEVAVQAFLEKRLRFDQIYHVLEKVVGDHRNVSHPVLNDIKQADVWARERALGIITKGVK